jgi:hypothetical protein
MVLFALSLFPGNTDVQMELVTFILAHLLNGAFHLLYEVTVEFRVEMIALILVKTLNRFILFAKMLAHNTNDRFLHLLFKNVVLSASVDFVEKFFLSLLVGGICFLLRHWDGSLILKFL